MLDVTTGQSAPSSTAAQMPGRTFFGVGNRNYTLTLDTNPTGQSIKLAVARINASGGTQVISTEDLTTPVTRVYNPAVTGEGLYIVVAFSTSGALIEFSKVSVLASAQLPNTSFSVVLHLAGDFFTALTTAEAQQLTTNLLTSANARLGQAGIQVNVGASSFRRLTTNSIKAQDSSLVTVGGNTYLDGTNTDSQTRRWGALGIPASDATFGKALDVFLVEADQGIPGYTAVDTAIRGTIFTGAGSAHCVVVAYADRVGGARTTSELGYIIAHEISHALGLAHTTDPSLAFDPIPDTPHGVKSDYDTNSNGVFGSEEASPAHPDYSNLLYPYVGSGGTTPGLLTAHQGAVMRSYLAVQEH
ncbi:MAG: hypothetical protein AB7N76_05250 [Planctomycetota bacterium]